MQEQLGSEYAHAIRLLRFALSHERQKRVSIPLSVLPPQPALQQRVSKRITEAASDSHKRAFVAKEIRKEPME